MGLWSGRCAPFLFLLPRICQLLIISLFYLQFPHADAAWIKSAKGGAF